MEQTKPTPKPRTRRYEKSSNPVAINDETRASLPNNAQRLLPGVNDLLHEVKSLKQQLSVVKEERDEFKEEVTFLKYQLAYRAQVHNLQKSMSEKKEAEKQPAKKQKSVRFSSNISIEEVAGNEEGEVSDSEVQTDDSFNSSVDWDDYNRLKAEKEELEDVLHDFYHDSKMADNNERVLVGNIDSHPSESISSLICRVLVNYEKLSEEKRILEEEKSKLDEDKVQLTTSMGKLREQLHDAVDSNIEEIEDLNRENEELRFKAKTLTDKMNEGRTSLLHSHERTVSCLKTIMELIKNSKTDKINDRLKRDISEAEKELEQAKISVYQPEESDTKLKRVKSLPPSFRRETPETTERGGLLRELKTCKDLQESQRKQIQKILEEKLELEVNMSEIKRQNVVLRAERRAHGKTLSKFVQTENASGGSTVAPITGGSGKENNDQLAILSRKCKDLEKKLEEAKQEKTTVEEEKTCLLMSLDANIEKKDALEEQVNALQAQLDSMKTDKKATSSSSTVSTQTDAVKVGKDKSNISETDGVFQASYKKDISEVKVGIEKIRIQEQDKQITILKRENEAVKEKLKKAEDMSQTLQNCLKELTDEKHELLDSIEELNEEKAELEESRKKLEAELSGTKREKFVVDEVSDIRKKEQKLGNDIEVSKAKLAQLDLKVVEVLTLIGNGKDVPKIDSRNGLEDMIGSLLTTVENLKQTVTTFKKTYDKTKGESLQTKSELQAISKERNELQNRVDELNKKVKDMAASLESSSKPRVSYDSKFGQTKNENVRVTRELEKIRDAKVVLEKSMAEKCKREKDLERQLKEVRSRKDELLKAFDQLTGKCNESTSLLAETTKEVEQARRTNEKLTKELEHLREDLEGTVEDRDELLELLDRIVCENGSGEERLGLGLKVERIRERTKSDETLSDVSSVGSGKGKLVDEKYLVSSQTALQNSSSGEDELFITVPKGDLEIERNKKRIDELLEENHQLKEMVEKVLNDQKKMEVALSSFSEANAEIQQDLEESIEHTEQIRVQGPESNHGKDVVDHGAGGHTKGFDNENAELRKLHEVMIETNEALSVHLQRLQDEKARNEQLRNSWNEVSQKNATLESNLESVTKQKATMEKELSAQEKKRKELEQSAERAAKEKQDLQNLLDESKARAKDLKFQIESLTEINKDLRETNERVTEVSKETEKKWSKVNDDFDELEFENEALEKVNKRLHQQLAELRQQKTDVELDLQRSKETITSLKKDTDSHLKRSKELQSTVDSNAQEIKNLKETATKVSELQEKAKSADSLKSEMENVKNTVVEGENRIKQLEGDVSRLTKEIENSQRFVKVVSQENDSLRDSLTEWEREANKIRKHVHQVSQHAERRNESGGGTPSVKKEQPLQASENTSMSVKAFEAMQMEMDAVNKHLKSLTSENKELNSTVETISKENSDMKDRNIQLLTRYDMLSKEMEKKDAEMNKLRKDLKNAGSHAQTNIQSRDKLEKKNSLLEENCGKLERENAALRNSLASTLDEERVLAEKLRSLVEFSKSSKQASEDSKNPTTKQKKIISDDKWILKSDKGELVTTKPDLIRHSKEAENESAVEQKKYNSEYFALENSGVGKDAEELVQGLLKERSSLRNQYENVVRVFQEMNSRNVELRKKLEGFAEVKRKKEDSLLETRTELDKMNQVRTNLEGKLEESENEVAELTKEKTKLENEASVIKAKCDKLQAVFRALVLLMNDKKGKGDGDKVGRQSEESDGSTRLIDYIKNIKTKYTGLVTEKENLEEKVKSLQREVEGYKTKEKMETKPSRNTDSEKARDELSQTKTVLEEKERVLKELLLTSARDKRRFVEKLQEVYEEFVRVKTRLDEELQKQRKTTPTSVLALEKIYQEFVESLTHTERFAQSVAHERRVTVVADTTSKKDANLELAKENEELIGKINAIQSSRRRETKNLKDELTKISREKEDAITVVETKCKSEIAAAKEECQKKLMEKEQVVADVKNSWKEEVDQLKRDIQRISSENEVAQRTLKKESRLMVDKLESKNKMLKADLDKIAAEKKNNDSKMAEMKRKHIAETKEKEQLAESEISHVRANWADAERKFRDAAEEKLEAKREVERVNQEKREQETKAAREIQKYKTSFETVQKQSIEREDVHKRERDRLQQTISVLEQAFKKSEVSSLERTETRISEFQRTLEGLAQKNKLLESAKINSEQTLGAELENLRLENAKLQKELREIRDQRRVVVNSKDQPVRTESSLPPPPAERVKVVRAVKQPPIDKPRLVSPLESAVGSFPVSNESQRRVKVRESQTAVIHKGRVKEPDVRRTSDHRDPVFEELGVMFQELNDKSNWSDTNRTATSVIQARPVQKRTEVNNLEMQPQKPQPEWEPERSDGTWPLAKDHRRNISQAASRQQQTPSPTTAGRSNAQSVPQRVGHVKEDQPRNRPPSTKPKPTSRRGQNTMEAFKVQSSSAENLNRHQVEVKRLPVERNAKSVKPRETRRPSVGSDDVFLSEGAKGSSGLMSHGGKNSDFWRSRSLTDLTDTSEEKSKTKHREHHHTSKKHKTKLPKSFSGPRKLESSKPENAHASSTSSAQQLDRNGKDTKAKKVTPLKGMEYVIFQHQI